MTQAQARQLKVGDRVQWIDDGAIGTAIETGCARVSVKWDDAITTHHYFAQPDQCKTINKVMTASEHRKAVEGLKPLAAHPVSSPEKGQR